MSTYAFYRQVHPPTGIEHCIYCNFFNNKENNLVIAGVNKLSVYRINHNAEVLDGRPRRDKLELLAQYSLFGNVMSLGCVRLSGGARDSLLLSFSEAKLAIVEYDPDVHDLRTQSLHYFEEYEMKAGHLQQSIFQPIVRVDPEGRCAAMLIYGTRLVVLPFRKEVGEDLDTAVSGKGNVLSSYIIDLRELDEKITNVLDFHFLHGYYEPTVLLLYEPLPTWSGRVAVRKDSCAIVAISLNLVDRVQPIIWSLAGLPFDCYQAMPVPKPTGGVLVFAANSLIYLNQSVPPFGVSLNQITDVSTDFLLRAQDGVRMTLECCQAAFLCPDQLVLSLKGGELYVLTLLVDSMRCVKNFHFEKAAASVLTTCICQCEAGFLFLGSRLGNSLLLKYSEKKAEQLAMVAPPVKIKQEPRSKDERKKPRTDPDDVGEWMASDVNTFDDDLYELEVYGREVAGLDDRSMHSYSFEVCDSLLNIGPCGRVVMGEPAFLSEEFAASIDPDLELISTSGYGKNGALAVLQRSIRPQVVTTFELPGCADMWTVLGAPVSEPERLSRLEGDRTHSLLILSRGDSSMVLQTGQEIMELDHSGFQTSLATVSAGNLLGDQYVVQVTAAGIHLMKDTAQVHYVAVENSPIVDVSICDPFMVLLCQDGRVLLATLVQAEDGEPGDRELSVTTAQLYPGTRPLTLAAYRDVSGLFTSVDITPGHMDMEPEPEVEEVKPDITLFVDDEDDLLYGEPEKPPEPMDDEVVELPQPVHQHEVAPTYWCVLAREGGTLEIYSLPDFIVAFTVKNFPTGNRVLTDSGMDEAADQTPIVCVSAVRELLLVGLGNLRSRPYLMARVDDDLYIYEAFPYQSATPEPGRLHLAFRKMPHGLLLRERKLVKSRRRGEEDEGAWQKQKRTKWLRLFDDISGYAGVFICGPYPHWLFMSSRGAMRIHPMGIDGWVTSFAPFNNVNCPKGFLYFNKQGELRISVLPTHLSYDACWPIRKVALRCTPHHVVYHPESKTYSVITSVPEPLNRIIRIATEEGTIEFESQERPERFLLPQVDRFTVQLFSPVSWEPIPNTKYEFKELEHATCMAHVMLRTEGTLTGMKGFIVVGTGMNYGEDVTSRGRILIFDVIEVVPEVGQPLTKNRMKLIYDKEQKGPLTALACVNGLLVSAIGQKIYIWQLKDNDLCGAAFIDTQVYIVSLTVIKNMILAGDVLKSVSLLRYQPDLKVLSYVSRDIKPLEVYSTAFMVDNTSLSFLVSDRHKNLVVYAYQPEVRESHGGTRLVRAADMNIGSNVNTFWRVRCKLVDPSSERRAPGAVERRHINFMATLDGAIACLLPISEKVYRRLFMLQNALVVHTPQYAGLNPKSYRAHQSERRELANPNRNILDGDLLWLYLHLSTTERNELAKRIGTAVDQVIDDLMEMDRYTAHF